MAKLLRSHLGFLRESPTEDEIGFYRHRILFGRLLLRFHLNFKCKALVFLSRSTPDF